MRVKCKENNSNNTNFTVGKEYELSHNGVRCNLRDMLIHFEDYDRPRSFTIGIIFDFAMCKFEIVG